ncbi:hypothetical protein PSCICE_03480 [Pseudomonas cichorii]|nr:hypothetical protein PSCICE_03480 [Pseudomonas cichorii]
MGGMNSMQVFIGSVRTWSLMSREMISGYYRKENADAKSRGGAIFSSDELLVMRAKWTSILHEKAE